MTDYQQSNSLRVYGWNINTPKEDVNEFFKFVRDLGQNRQPYINENECYIDVHYNSADIARKASE